jgi:hypothetical protein
LPPRRPFPPVVLWEADPDQRLSAQIQSLCAHGTSTRHFRFSAPLGDMEVKFVIELQVGWAADSSCHDPYRWAVAPSRTEPTSASPAKLKIIPIKGVMKRMQLSFWIRPSPAASLVKLLLSAYATCERMIQHNRVRNKITGDRSFDSECLVAESTRMSMRSSPIWSPVSYASRWIPNAYIEQN